MNVNKVNDEVYVSTSPVVQFNLQDLQWLKECATRNPRRRVRLCAHRTLEDRLHEMLIVLREGTYIRPHRHRSKTESFHVVEGAADLVMFDEAGGIQSVTRLGPPGSGSTFYLRNEASDFHTLVVRTEFFVIHETTNGPFDRSDSLPAPWSPGDQDLKAGAAFMAELAVRVDRHPAGN